MTTSVSALDRLFEARSIALIGASGDDSRLASRPLRWLRRHGWPGEILLVNASREQIDGRPCHPSIDALPDGVDLALILLPAAQVADALARCARRGIAFAIAIAGGFAEAGAPALQASLTAICRETGIRLVGPNCIGVIDPHTRLSATFSSVLQQHYPRPGSLALVSQSGALANAALQGLIADGTGLRALVSCGNEADLDALDFVEHFIADDRTELIALIVEGLRQPQRLPALAQQARARGKALAVLALGRSARGRQAAHAHTGKPHDQSEFWRSLHAAKAAITLDGLDDLGDLARLFEIAPPVATRPLRALGVLSPSGGQGVLIADRAEAAGLEVPALSAQTLKRLAGDLPAMLNLANPVDTALFANRDSVMRCAQAMLEDSRVEVVALTVSRMAHDYDALLAALIPLAREAGARGKLLALSPLASSDRPTRGQRMPLQAAGALVLPTPERIIAALGRRSRALEPPRTAPLSAPDAPVPAPTDPRRLDHERATGP